MLWGLIYPGRLTTCCNKCLLLLLYMFHSVVSYPVIDVLSSFVLQPAPVPQEPRMKKVSGSHICSLNVYKFWFLVLLIYTLFTSADCLVQGRNIKEAINIINKFFSNLSHMTLVMWHASSKASLLTKAEIFGDENQVSCDICITLYILFQPWWMVFLPMTDPQSIFMLSYPSESDTIEC